MLIRFICVLCATSSSLVGATMKNPQPQVMGLGKPNILFIISDDQSWEALGCTGGEVKTPNLDRLVSEGTFFKNSYNMGAWQGAVCVASRTMLVTGKSLWNAGAFERSSEKDTSSFWSRQFQRAGYRTCFSGKWHVRDIDPRRIYDVTGTVRPGMPRYQDPSREKPHQGAARSVGYFRPQSPDKDNWDPSDPAYGGHWEGGKHWSEVLGDEGIAFIESAAKWEQPFFMHLAFSAPHDPRQSPKEFVDLYPVDQIQVPENFLPENPHAKAMDAARGLRDEDLAPFPRTEYAVQKHRQEYYAIITHMDAQVGRLLRALEATGQRDNTLIVFTSDHGLSCGQHGLMGKQNMFEHSMKPPLIFVGNGIPQGRTIDAPVYMQDLVPTTLELAGLKIPSTQEFKSLLPVIKNREPLPHPSIYGAYKNRQRMVCKDGMKLIWYPESDTYLLFDLENDPREIHNLSNDPEHAGTVAELQSELKKQQHAYRDPLLAKEIDDGV